MITPGTPSSLELDEEEMRQMVRTSLDRILDHLHGMAQRPTADTSRGAAVARSLIEPAPEVGAPFETLLARVFDDVIPASVNTAGPGYLAYIPGGGLFHAAVADFISKSVNRHVGYWYMAPAMVQLEWTVIRWFCEIVGYGPEAGGVLTSGGSMASLTALIAARTTRLPEDFRHGVIYVTSQTHYSVAKAAVLAGFPARCLRTIAVDESFRMDVSALGAAVAVDRAAGLVPFMVVGSAGTTNTGAIDPLDQSPTWPSARPCGFTSTAPMAVFSFSFGSALGRVSMKRTHSFRECRRASSAKRGPTIGHRSAHGEVEIIRRALHIERLAETNGWRRGRRMVRRSTRQIEAAEDCAGRARAARFWTSRAIVPRYGVAMRTSSASVDVPPCAPATVVTASLWSSWMDRSNSRGPGWKGGRPGL